MKTVQRTAALALLLIAAGCSTTSVFERLRVGKASPENPAIEVVCLWQPAKGTGTNGLPTRGMAGQIMFFTRGSAAPVIAEGDVRIYEFDDQGTPEELGKPIHQFDFRAEDWRNFLHQGTLGPCYNIFVPYVRGGHKQVECTMQMRFSSKGAPTLYSDMTSVTLPGTIDQSDSKDALASSPRTVEPKTSAATVDGPSGLSVRSIPTGRNPSVAKGPHPLERGTPAVPANGYVTPVSATDSGSSDERAAAVQRASQEVPVSTPAAGGSDERIRQLEQTVRELMKERSSRSSPPAAFEGEPTGRLTPQHAHPLADALTESPPRNPPPSAESTPKSIRLGSRGRIHKSGAEPIRFAPPREVVEADDGSENFDIERADAPRRRIRPAAARLKPNAVASHPLLAPVESDEDVPHSTAESVDDSSEDERVAPQPAAPRPVRTPKGREATRVVSGRTADDEDPSFVWQQADPWKSR